MTQEKKSIKYILSKLKVVLDDLEVKTEETNSDKITNEIINHIRKFTPDLQKLENLEFMGIKKKCDCSYPIYSLKNPCHCVFCNAKINK